MEIKINETGKIETLCITDKGTGTEWTQDLIGNAGAINDGQFGWDDKNEVFTASQETYDWWKKYIEDYEQTEKDIDSLHLETGLPRNDLAWRVQDEAYGNDYGDHRSNAIRVMNEIREENK